MKIVTILGARPQFIKAGTVSREIAKYPEITEVIVHTGQHYDANMSDIFFEQMQIAKPDYFLGINGKGHGAMTGQMLEKIEEVLIKEKPDWVMVYGDTNSTLAGALAAVKLHIKLVHVEAGLRSFNMQMPEEINRILTDRVSSVLFAPSKTAIENLEKEGFSHFNCEVLHVGDVMQDGAIFYKNLAQKPIANITDTFVLATVHRAENTDDLNRLKGIITALNEIHQKTEVLVPIHPRTKALIDTYKLHCEFTMIEPVGYLEMVWLLKNCHMVISDSGGLQKEAFFFEKPCMTLRDDTEWWELIEGNYNKLVGADSALIVDTFVNHQFNDDYSLDLFGGGMASQKIIEYFLTH
ncbi:MAG: UDP-N-acetylglucosamine 2-epimerase (non-hydrolyzing) [Epsilonproteobacteria bacterium]|nr:UDP-N-acetylglucosamine 2-epimerase (non-hydrolyzing) [Campylobacterota bacterium]